MGVDIFFVISGFLMSGILVRQFGQHGARPSLTEFYARRARRLLPASLLTIVVVVFLAWTTLPDIRKTDVMKDAVASTVFGMNWRMSAESIDYLSATTGPPSPLQHYWSLGVEEQFYFVWPALLIVAAVAGRTIGISRAKMFAATIAATIGISLAYSIHFTSVNPAQAYFVTWTRLWELAAGGLVAVCMLKLGALSKLIGASLAWLGLLLAVVPALFYTDSTPFPGSAAIVPVVGTMLIIGAGPAAGRAGPVLVLSRLPMRRIGDWSYSLYLWHWPVLVFGAAWVGRELTQTEALLMLGASFGPALLAYRYVEEPARRAKSISVDADALRLGGISILMVAVVPVVMLAVIPKTPPTNGSMASAIAAIGGAQSAGDPSIAKAGAEVLRAEPRNDPAGAPTDVEAFYPSLAQVASTSFGCSAETTANELKFCTFGDPESNIDVVLAGDSHAVQWSRALATIAKDNAWNLTVVTKDFCPLVVGVSIASDWASSCEAWQRSASAWLQDDPPDLLIVSQYDYTVRRNGKDLTRDESDQLVGSAQQRLFSVLAAAGSKIAVIKNTPQLRTDFAACVARYQSEISKCSVSRDSALRGVGGAQRLSVIGVKNSVMIDLNDAICPTDRCAPVIGGILVYRDGNHMTTTYGESLAPRLKLQLPLP